MGNESDRRSRPRGAARTLIASSAGLALSYSVITFGSFSFMILPISQEFGWGRGDLSIALLILNGTVAISSLPVGAAIDRWGARHIVIGAQVTFSLILILLSFFAGSFATFLALYFVMGIVGTAHSPPAYSKIVVQWFDRGRGTALALALVGVGVGYTLIPLASEFIVAEYGWRNLYRFLALLVLLIAFPLSLAWLRSPRQNDTAIGTPNQGLTFLQALRSRPLLLMLAGFGIAGLFSGGYYAHIVPLLADRGVSSASAAGTVAVSGAALIAGRLAAGMLLDRLHAPWVVVGFMSMATFGFLILFGDLAGYSTTVAAMLIGLSLGAEMDFMSYLVSRYCGVRDYGKLMGLVYGTFVFGTALGPVLLGYSHQLSGDYQLGLALIGALSLISLPMFALLGPYPLALDDVLPGHTDEHGLDGVASKGSPV